MSAPDSDAFSDAKIILTINDAIDESVIPKLKISSSNIFGANMSDPIPNIVSALDMMLEDNSIPRNVRASIQKARTRLTKSDDKEVALSGAVYALEEISNDINIPMHARTMVWNIISELEGMKQ